MKAIVKRYALTLLMCFVLVAYIPTCTVHAKKKKPESNNPTAIEVLDYVYNTGDEEYFLEHQDLFPSEMVNQVLKANSDTWEEMVKAEEERIAALKGPQEYHLTMYEGAIMGPSGKETYYNLDMSGVVSIMRSYGYSEEDYPYWVREDGVKMLGDYVMVAASFDIRPRGTILDSSLGSAIVCDTGGFASYNQTQLDIAVDW